MVALVTGECSLLVVPPVEGECSLGVGSVIILSLSTMERTALDQSMKQGHAIPFTAQLMEITVSGQNSCNAVLHVAKEYRHVPEAVLTHLLNTVEKTARHLVHLWKIKSAT